MSYDGKGSELVSVVHVGNKFANAFWSTDGGFMAYGDGDGAVMGDLTRSLDVAGHEMTHGVTSATSKLIYMDESGALNEAFSDFFGIVIAARAMQRQPDWAIGKEIFNNERKLIGLRNLKDPSSIKTRFLTQDGAFEARPYPTTVAEKFESFGPCTQRNDRCYVHVNSMIPGRAMVLISEAIGLDQAEKLMYLTLTQYLTASSGFAAFKQQTLAACESLLSKTDCEAVTAAFTTVGF
jgi:neutral peptidase B